jgi:IMP dehydrogenase
VVTVVADERDPDETPVAEVMTSPVERVTTGLELGEAATMMVTYGIKHLPVINDHGDYVGMVSSTDITVDFS